MPCQLQEVAGRRFAVAVLLQKAGIAVGFGGGLRAIPIRLLGEMEG